MIIEALYDEPWTVWISLSAKGDSSEGGFGDEYALRRKKRVWNCFPFRFFLFRSVFSFMIEFLLLERNKDKQTIKNIYCWDHFASRLQ